MLKEITRELKFYTRKYLFHKKDCNKRIEEKKTFYTEKRRKSAEINPIFTMITLDINRQAALKLNIQKTKIMECGLITLVKHMGKR